MIHSGLGHTEKMLSLSWLHKVTWCQLQINQWLHFKKCLSKS